MEPLWKLQSSNWYLLMKVKFIYSEKATKVFEKKTYLSLRCKGNVFKFLWLSQKTSTLSVCTDLWVGIFNEEFWIFFCQVRSFSMNDRFGRHNVHVKQIGFIILLSKGLFINVIFILIFFVTSFRFRSCFSRSGLGWRFDWNLKTNI